MLLLFGILTLSSCDGKIPEKDDIPILKDVDNDDKDDDTKVPEDLTPLEEFEYKATKFNEKASKSNAFQFELNFTTNMMSLSDLNDARERQTKTSIHYDKDETYYYNQVMEYYYERPLHQSSQTFHQQLIDARSGTLKEYEIEGHYASVKEQFPSKTFDGLLEERDVLDYDFFDLDSVLSVEIEDDIYKVTVDMNLFEDGIIANRFDFLHYEETDELTIEYRFTEYSVNYTVSFEEEYMYQTDRRYLVFEYTGQVEVWEYLNEKISVYEEPYILELPESKEDIIMTTELETHVYKFVNANKVGWMRYVLTPGYYRFFDGGVFNGVIYTPYDEEGNPLDFEREFYLDDTITVYVKAEATERIEVISVFDQLDINDLVYEDHHLLQSGTIAGYNEGFDDLSTYHLNGTSPIGGLIVIDASHMNSRQELYIRSGTHMCELTEEDTCVLLVEPNQEVEFVVHGEYENAFTFDYYFVEKTVSSTVYEDMLHLNDIDGTFTLTQTEPLYLKFDVILYDRYYFWIYDLMEQYNTTYIEIYTAEGDLVEPSYSYYYQLGLGSYYVKITTGRHYGIYNIDLRTD